MKSTAIILVLSLILFCSINALSQERYDYSNITRLHWANPNQKPITYDEYLRKNTFSQNANLTLISSTIRENEVPICIIVNSQLYPEIETHIDTYISDLEREGYAPLLYSMENDNDVTNLRLFLLSEWEENNIIGAVLIGDLPVPWYEMIQWDEDYVQFPCDLYFMDLDGTWYDEDENGIFDDHDGEMEADIWIGRLYASPLTMYDITETDAINNYFDKNHAYRTGSQRLEDHALAFIDDDWQSSGWQYILQQAYPQTDDYHSPELTTREVYINRVQKASNHQYESMLLCAHSWPQGHAFTQQVGDGYFYNNEVEELDVQINFYNQFNCSGLRYIEPDCIGSWYVFQSEYGLLSVGSTKTGSMLIFEDYYPLLGDGQSHGDAFLYWAQQNMEFGLGNQLDSRSWFYGMTIMGDPTLLISRFYLTANMFGEVKDASTEENIFATVTDNLGGYVFDTYEDGSLWVKIVPGTRTFSAETYGYYPGESEEITIENFGVGYIAIYLEALPQGSLSGNIYNAVTGESIAGAEITILDTPIPTDTTDTEGYYVFSDVPGDWNYQISCSAINYKSLSMDIYILPQEPTILNLYMNPILSFEDNDGGFIGEGEWEWGLAGQDGSPAEAYDGQYLWGTNLSDFYGDHLIYDLYTTSYSLDDSGEVYLEFYHWIDTKENWDGGNIQISNDGGENWEIIQPIGGYPKESIIGLEYQPGFSGQIQEWEYCKIDLTDYTGDEVQFRFHFGSFINNLNCKGWFIDYLAVIGNNVSNIQNEKTSVIPEKIQLYQNYPNPFNPSTNIAFSLLNKSKVDLKIYNLQGNLVKTLVNDIKQAGFYNLIWDGRDERGKPVPSGVYIYKIDTDNHSNSKQMILLK